MTKDTPHADGGQKFNHIVAANSPGGTIAGIVVVVLLWAATKGGGAVNQAFATAVLLASTVGGVIFAERVHPRHLPVLIRSPARKIAREQEAG